GGRPLEARTSPGRGQGSSACVSSLSSCRSLDQQLPLVSGSVNERDVERVEAARLAVDLDRDSLVQGVPAARGEVRITCRGNIEGDRVTNFHSEVEQECLRDDEVFDAGDGRGPD